MLFKYIAYDQAGKIVEGSLEAAGTVEALTQLARRGLKPVSLKRLKEARGRPLAFFGQSITAVDKIFLTKYLALMLKVGTDLFKAIDILIEDFEKPILKSFLREIRVSLEKGQPFYTTFERYPKYFSPVFVNMVKSGEASGTLEQVFSDLSVSLEKEQDLKSKIRSALFYPILLFIMAAGILTFLVVFALPRIANVFTSAGVTPPVFSRLVFTVGLFLGANIGVILISAAVTVAGLFIFIRKTVPGRRFFAWVLASTPVIKDVVYKITLQRFAGTFAALIKSALPIIESLKITAGTLTLDKLRIALLRIAEEGVARGLTIGEAFKKEPIFPATVSNLIAISEKAGHLDEILRTLADFYESEINASIKTLVSVLEPVLLIMIGAIIGLIALSIIVPIYQLIGQF
jgi:type II secretory pathway component PulF